MNLQNKTVLITGGNRGLGFALAKELSFHVQKILLVGRDEKSLKEATIKINNAEYIVCDLTDQNDIDSLIVKIEQQYPQLSVIVNNAGIQNEIDFQGESSNYSKIVKEMTINFLAPVQLISVLLPLLIAQNESLIVNITSGLALFPKSNAPIYCASKAALRSFTQSLRHQLENTSVKVIECLPPVMNTSMTAHRDEKKLSSSKVAKIIVQSILKNKIEIKIGIIKVMKLLGRFFPNLITRKVQNAK